MFMCDKPPKKKLDNLSPWMKLLQENYEKMISNEDEPAVEYTLTSLKKNVSTMSWTGHHIGVITSGGDSQGMNAAIRAIARFGIFLGCRVFYIKEGYEGMIEGGSNFEEATMLSTSCIINVGGTLIGSARCKKFQERQGRLKAAKNLIQRGINSIIVIGGDGSLTGANLFRQEWPSLVRELIDTDMVSSNLAHKLGHLNIVGIVGSIDNDFCGTDITLGTDSALHRILGSIDDITTTAVSHKRAFVLEIMGRMCGYLPLVAGIASEASVIFIPENPPPGDWKQFLCDELNEKSKGGEIRRTHIVLVAEGAIDRNLNPIKSSDVQKVLSDRLKMDTRVTVLGHVQRGGMTSACDRILGSRQGVEAVLSLMEATPKSPASVIGTMFTAISRIHMMKAVEKTKLIGQLLEDGEFEQIVKLRGTVMSYNLYVQHMLSNVSTHPRLIKGSRKRSFRVAMVHVGEPACGMNAVARAFVIVALAQGYHPVFIFNSWEGLLEDTVQVMNRNEVHLWTGKGGSTLGTSVLTAEDVGIEEIATKLSDHNISGLMIVGGFEAFESACQISEARSKYEPLCIPIIVVPATMQNNFPGSDQSLGFDSAVNQICKACDDLKSSALSLKKCVYVVEVGGGNCGCLAILAGIATGADRAFVREEPFTVKDLQDTCKMLKNKLEISGVKHGLILKNENANPNLTTDFIYRMFNEEGRPEFTARKSVLGGTQQSNSSSPHDRTSGLKMGMRSTLWLIQCLEKNGALGFEGIVYTNTPDSLVICSMQGGKVGFKTVEELIPQTDFKHCVPKYNWWLELMPLFEIFSRYST